MSSRGAASVALTAEDAHALVADVRPDITAIAQNGNRISAETRDILTSINQGKGTLGKLATDEEFYRKLNTTIGDVDAVMAGIRNGDGSIGKLFKDPSLYDGLHATSREVRELLGDFRKDPRKFLTIQLKIF